MIERYSRKQIKNIWEEKNKYKIWLDIEIAAAQAMEKYKIIPRGVSYKVKKKAKIDVNRILVDDVRSAITEEKRRIELIKALEKLKK